MIFNIMSLKGSVQSVTSDAHTRTTAHIKLHPCCFAYSSLGATALNCTTLMIYGPGAFV